MSDFYASLILVEKLFFYCAVFGGILFAVRLLIMIVGGHGGDFDMSGTDALHGTTDFGHGIESDISFKVLTLQGVSGFFLMFGLVGLSISRLLPAHTTAQQALALLGGAAVGVFTMWVIAKLFSMMLKLQSDGTVDMQNAIGQPGTVYLNIPAEGTGKVQVVVQGSLSIFDAVSGKKEPLKTGVAIKVTAITGGSILVVEKA